MSYNDQETAGTKSQVSMWGILYNWWGITWCIYWEMFTYYLTIPFRWVYLSVLDTRIPVSLYPRVIFYHQDKLERNEVTREQLAIIYDIEVSQNPVKNWLSWEEIRDFSLLDP